MTTQAVNICDEQFYINIKMFMYLKLKLLPKPQKLQLLSMKQKQSICFYTYISINLLRMQKPSPRFIRWTHPDLLDLHKPNELTLHILHLLRSQVSSFTVRGMSI